jgi:hypothetical protein
VGGSVCGFPEPGLYDRGAARNIRLGSDDPAGIP